MIRNITGYGKGQAIAIFDGFLGGSSWFGFAPNADRLILDTHQYMVSLLCAWMTSILLYVGLPRPEYVAFGADQERSLPVLGCSGQRHFQGMGNQLFRRVLQRHQRVRCSGHIQAMTDVAVAVSGSTVSTWVTVTKARSMATPAAVSDRVITGTTTRNGTSLPRMPCSTLPRRRWTLSKCVWTRV
jgi:hypothetical protein